MAKMIFFEKYSKTQLEVIALLFELTDCCLLDERENLERHTVDKTANRQLPLMDWGHGV